MNKQKGISILIVSLIVVGAVIISGGGVWLWQNWSSVKINNPAPVSTPSITITSPNGGEQWVQESTTQIIRWNVALKCSPTREDCLLPGYDIKLSPISSPSTLYTVAFNISGNCDGSNDTEKCFAGWGVGRVYNETGGITKLPIGNYIIKVCQNGTNICDSGDNYFSIVAPTAQPQCQTDNDCREISCPATGGFAHEKCVQGKCTLPAEVKNRCSIKITVTSPNGGETWQQNSTQTITWRDDRPVPLCPAGAYCSAPRPMQYDVYLSGTCASTICTDVARPSYLLASNVAGLSYSWGTTNTAVGSYKIKVCETGTSTCDLSDKIFTITPSSIVCAQDTYRCPNGLYVSRTGSKCEFVCQPSITVTSPNGGEQWSTGTMQTIRWLPGSYSAVANNVVSVQLQTSDAKNMVGCPGYQAGLPNHTYDCRYYTLFNDAQNNGTAQWVVGKTSTGASIPPGSYYMRVYLSEIGMETAHYLSAQGYNTEDYSDAPFSIIASSAQPSITVTSPNGGEEWRVGRTYNITWNTTGSANSGTVYLYLKDASIENGAFSGVFTSNSTPASAGVYSWTIPSVIPAGEGITSAIPIGGASKQYKIMIVDSVTGAQQSLTDDSDSYFSIIYEPVVPLKPVIYLYPQKVQQTRVQLDYAGKFIADYPAYDYNIGGWDVVAYPDGKIINSADGKEYSYLFWEGNNYNAVNYDLSKGFVVKGSEVREFLQSTLSKMGLTPKEYNEFIVYWYPKMKDNAYNLVHFASEEYTDTAKLTITPAPDSMLRVFMVFKPLDKEISVVPQEIKPFDRQGFAVVEWGGSELSK